MKSGGKADLTEYLDLVAQERGLTVDALMQALCDAMLAAYKRRSDAVMFPRVEFDPDTSEFRVIEQVLDDVDDAILEERDVTPDDFGRIQAQAAKQVLSQKIREVERDKKYADYVGKEGSLVTGIIQQSDNRYTLLDLGNVEALLPQAEQVPHERYDNGARVKAYIVEVRKTTKGPQIVVSRTHPGLIKELFALEVPEISSGIVEIKGCAREPGHRTKIAVASLDQNVDPVGACVGARGARVRMVTNEVFGEKIDIVPFSDDTVEYVMRALQPARVKEVRLDEYSGTATVIVPDNQLSLAIGKDGQNVRLANRLTGWRIDIRSETDDAYGDQYTGGDWAEGEWITDASGELVWQPAEGGEALTADAWSAGGAEPVPGEADVVADAPANDTEAAAESAEVVEAEAEVSEAEVAGDAEASSDEEAPAEA